MMITVVLLFVKSITPFLEFLLHSIQPCDAGTCRLIRTVVGNDSPSSFLTSPTTVMSSASAVTYTAFLISSSTTGSVTGLPWTGFRRFLGFQQSAWVISRESAVWSGWTAVSSFKYARASDPFYIETAFTIFMFTGIHFSLVASSIIISCISILPLPSLDSCKPIFLVSGVVVGALDKC